ncbi:MAG: hypothetical protein RMJ56_02320 [Gemmataceae bacterium]|nr:hypothetical protein [Gemmata sp.]MDW8196421.1 hypothetical protein [Gemmataceae bacterium]
MIRRAILLVFICASLASCERTIESPAAHRDADPQSNTLPSPPPREMVEHPTYKLWGHFPVGTRVALKTTTDSRLTPGQTVTTIVYTLREKTDDHIVVESQATTLYHGGRVEKNPPTSVRTQRLIALPPDMKKEDWGKAPPGQESAEEEITVLGKTYKCLKKKTRSSTDAGEMITTTWTSPEMPGGLVQSIAEVQAVQEVTTIEVTEVEIPEK